MQRGQNSRTGGAVSWCGLLFLFWGGGLVNIMQLHNKIEEAGLYFFLCVVFLFHLL